MKLLFAILLSAASFCFAALGWGLPSGAATMKYLTIESSPREAGLAGAGLADPTSASEAAGNPMAGAWTEQPVISGSQAILAARLGAYWNTFQVVQPLQSVRLLIGANFLDVSDLQGYDDNANPTAAYGVFAYSARLGLASDSGAFTWGLQGSFQDYSIDQFSSQAFLCDAVMGYRLGSRVRVAAGIFHMGSAGSFDTQPEYAPMTLQAGISTVAMNQKDFRIEIHTDLRRETDGPKELLLGLESTYAKTIVFRIGINALNLEPVPSAGLGLNVGPVQASYGYTGNRELKGNHQFGLSYLF